MTDPARPAFGLQRVLEVLKRRKALAAVVLAVVFVAAMSFVWSLPALYRSTATVLVDRKDVPQTFVTSAVTGELETRLETITEEVLSRGRLQDLVERFDLYPGLRRHGAAEDAVDQMRKDIRREVKATEGTGGRPTTIAILVSYRGRDPRTVADVTNALASLYVEQNSTMRQRQATGTAQFMKSQLADMKGKLEEQERHLGAQPQTPETDLAALERLNTRLRINSDRQLRDLDLRERMRTSAEAAEATAGGAPATETAASRLSRLKKELAELRTRFSEKYPDVIRTRAEVAALERQVADDPPAPAPAAKPTAKDGGEPAKIERDLRALKDEEQSLRQAIAMYEQRVEAAPRRLAQYQQQSRDYLALKEQYQVLAKRYEDAQIAERMEHRQKAEEFRILDTALPARGPIAPNRFRFGMLGFLVSLGMAAGAVVLSERMDRSFHSIDDLRAFSKVPVLAGIPRLVTEADAARRTRRRWLAVVSLLLALAIVAAGTHVLARGNDGLVRVMAPAGR